METRPHTELALETLNALNPQLDLPEPNEHCRPVHRHREFDSEGSEIPRADCGIDYTREPIHYLGAGQVPIVVGACSEKWGSPFALQQQKLGLIPRDPLNDPMKWGLAMEPLILHELGQELGVPVSRHNHIMKSQRWPWLGCLPDGLADALPTSPGSEWAGPEFAPAWVQAKNCAGFETWEQAEDGSFEPRRVWVQIQAELAVSGDPWEYVCALLTGNRFAWGRVPRDDRWIEEEMIPQCETFVGHLASGEQLPTDFTEATTKALIQLYPEQTVDVEIVLPASFIDIDDRYRDLKAAAKEIEIELAGIANKVRAEIGHAHRATVPGREGYWNAYAVKAGWVERHQRKAGRTLKRQPPKKSRVVRDGYEPTNLLADDGESR